MKNEIEIIKTKKQYTEALKRFEEIFLAEEGTTESKEADVLSVFIKDYEDKQFIINAPDPIEAIKYRMEKQGLTRKDLAKVIGKNRVTDIFNKHRALNLNQIRKLHEQWKMSLETLVKQYPLERERKQGSDSRT
jgi:HTH-type transcriptional regulator / antitoxin HigA